MLSQLNRRLSSLLIKFPGKLLAKILAGLFVFYLLFSYFAINPIAKRLVPYIAEKSLASKASVASVEFDPFRLKMTANHFQLSEKAGKPLAGFQKMIVDLELKGLFNRAWNFKQINFSAPRVDVAVGNDGQLNWQSLLDKLGENQSPPSDTIPRLIIENIIVSQGVVEYTDSNRPNPINTTLQPLGFQLKGFSTLPEDRGDYFISAAFENGGTLKWKGDMGINPVASKGEVILEGIKMAKMMQLVKSALPIKIGAGEAQTSFTYDYTMPSGVSTVALNNLTVGLSSVSAELKQGEMLSFAQASLSTPALSFVKNEQPRLQVKDIDFNLTDLNVKQGEVIQVALKEFVAGLPQLDFFMAENPQLKFDDLNLKFADVSVQKGNQLAVTLPVAAANAVRLDLVENEVTINEVVLSKVSLSKGSQAKKPMATLDQIALSDSLIGLSEQKISAQSLLLSGFKTAVIKKADQSINWAEMFERRNEATKAESIKNVPNVVEQKPWTLGLKKIALENADIHIQDNTTSTPVVLDVVKANIEVQDASLDMTKPLPVNATFSIKQGGRFSTKGTLWPSPLKVDLGLRLTGLSLKPFAPYVNQFALLKLDNGAADVSGKLTLKQQQGLALVFKGGFDVKNMALLEEADGAPFLSWDHLNSKTLNVSLMPNKLHVASLQVIKPSGKLIIFEDKTTNVKRILRGESEVLPDSKPESVVEMASQVPAAGSTSLIQAAVATQADAPVKKTPQVEPAPVTTTESTPEAFPVSVDSVRLNDAKLEFADLSLTPQFGTNIHSLNGVINGLATQVDKIAQVEMDGKVDEFGSARIRGSLQPFSATNFTDIKLAFTNLDMSRLTPYSGKFAGRQIDSGKLSVDLEYKIKQHQLTGKNKFVINKLKLGEKVDSTDAADLPLDLAIAILEDGDGVIDLNLPISGSLDDPKFSYGSIFWKAIRNVLTKIVTAPFKALGKIFGDGEKDFDGIAFEAGLSDISPPELEKLLKVSTALSKRKGLSLGIVPSYNTTLDTQSIKQTMYRLQIMEEIDVQLAVGQKPGPIDLTSEKVQDAIDTLYNKLTKKGFFKRMASKFEKPEDGHYEKAQAGLIASVEVTEEDLKKLAEARGKAILDVLINSGIGEERLAVMKVTDAKARGEFVKTELTLDVKQAAPEPAVIVEPAV